MVEVSVLGASESAREENAKEGLSCGFRVMPKTKQVTRQEITNHLTRSLLPLVYVRAFWEGGSAAFGRVDEWSDLDLYVMTRAGKTAAVFQSVEESLRRLSPISETLVISPAWEGVEQRFYSLTRASKYLFIDLAVLSETSSEKFTTPEIHGKNIFYIDRDGLEGSVRLDRPEFERRMRARRASLAVRFRMFDGQVQKYLNRNNAIEALEAYRSLVIGTLVELLRMNYTPEHYSFKMEHVHDELPKTVVRRLERLCYVKDEKDLVVKHAEAASWIERLLVEGTA